MPDELLNKEMFANLKEAKVLAEEYREYYNHHRPHGALGYLTPAEFAATKALKAPVTWPRFLALPRFRCSKTASGGSQDALTQQIKARPSVHLALDEL